MIKDSLLKRIKNRFRRIFYDFKRFIKKIKYE